MKKGICFTSVFNASELFHFTFTEFEKQKVKALLYAIKVLGVPARYSLYIPDLSYKFFTPRDALFYQTAKLNKLTIVTLHPHKYPLNDISIISF